VLLFALFDTLALVWIWNNSIILLKLRYIHVIRMVAVLLLFHLLA